MSIKKIIITACFTLIAFIATALSMTAVDSAHTTAPTFTDEEMSEFWTSTLSSSRLIFTKTDSVMRTMFIDFTPNGNFLMEIIDFQKGGNSSARHSGIYEVIIQDGQPILRLGYEEDQTLERFELMISTDRRKVFLGDIEFLLLFNQSEYYREQPKFS